ncbi:DUF2280 domain-containing protein [Paraburkholderia sp. CNPSo 3281]|uniref:DUF2280 domain-containing protein n=1 Tax=Paraburkholderia sp. CNPSo 3281 TaxID=2940933 RepID=UPI0020B74AEA|nr:DUF2280 domain-containing protein [Paraburkholderia sp. CNPSo 3281]MCP3713869.1 DUF2280 domain-containing protein [Paraburkholderia sp. CNPSo 3281]
MVKLDEQAKRYLVRCAAQFMSPSEAVQAVKEELGIEISRQLAEAYNPGRRMGVNLSAQLRELFETARREYLDDVESIPIANESWRLRELQRLFDAAVKREDVQVALSILKCASLEAADARQAKEARKWERMFG